MKQASYGERRSLLYFGLGLTFLAVAATLNMCETLSNARKSGVRVIPYNACRVCTHELQSLKKYVAASFVEASEGGGSCFGLALLVSLEGLDG
jgi:hypothetical protein